ncbi:RsmB/NOP family class I SAM-dependent RNA methyltransferase [Roseivivax sp. GX 12232]|uniref:RsmB/NOP family class I SAM-dependent RNA methyltransferase n=1 Tax=Roseivivax sp. GX 12232 TaxID=2900547 RepID=UPI001E2EB12A|nr:RsmB/NOP family class I SAM-dependent RNA methyltransferase [Roseivivax sp. GX 12232]MCE0507141.1 RsmB/NOP family class I SAM-dependent RNA methyltransferase [Roseivivax sp. GX 12232]
MTPGARVQAAVEILDRVAGGMAAEQALTRWARGARFAGSKDRAAVRDHVFDALRMWRSSAAAGGGTTGRARMIGLLRQQGLAPEKLFTGEGHAPAPLSDAEARAPEVPEAEARDLPDWLLEALSTDHGIDQAREIAQTLRARAPIILRVNLLKTNRDVAAEALAEEGIATTPNPRAETALSVTENPRRVAGSRAFREGLVELQDAASQAAMADLPLSPGDRVLDYCAGGGGKSLALAARLGGGPVWAHDADPRRMRDLPDRAARAGADLRVTDRPEGPFDLVLTDVPCSGSGTWRRAPEAKWQLTPEALAGLCATQAAILREVAPLVRPGGVLAYATCSVLTRENAAQVAAFLAEHPEFFLSREALALPDAEGDGFYHAVLQRAGA